jgi:putative SOS response-associated peptidase YedK
MCGRYRLSRRKEILAKHFEAEFSDLDWKPRYNIAPTQSVPVLRSDRDLKVKVSLMHWGLIPSWPKGQIIGAGTINARSETAATKPSFSEPLRTQRSIRRLTTDELLGNQ